MPMESDKKNASLTVIGTGIKSIAHATFEAKAHIEKSERLFYLTSPSLIDEWILHLNPKALSLSSLYFKYPQRIDCYREITRHLVDEVKKGQHVCAVLYGHPAVFAMPALNAAQQLKSEGYPAWILPGVSAEDCLFADLCIDPCTHGCQSYEATDFLLRRRQFETQCHLILWQVGIIGCSEHPKNYDNRRGAKVLAEYLAKHYGEKHEIILYEAATFPHESPRIEKRTLKHLPEADFKTITTLYVPPLGKKERDPVMLEALGIT